MAKTRKEILFLIKKQRPELTDEEAKQLLETLENYCELVINYTLKNGGDKEGNQLIKRFIISIKHDILSWKRCKIEVNLKFKQRYMQFKGVKNR